MVTWNVLALSLLSKEDTCVIPVLASVERVLEFLVLTLTELKSVESIYASCKLCELSLERLKILHPLVKFTDLITKLCVVVLVARYKE